MNALVAKTAPKERADGLGVWWKHYRVRRIPEQEWCAMREAGLRPRFASHQPYVLETRYIRTTGDTTTEEPWEVWEDAETAAAVIWNMLGDTAFQKAESLHPLHLEAIARLRCREEALARIDDAKSRETDTLYALKQFKDAKQAEYERRWNRTKSEEKRQALTARMAEEMRPELGRLKGEVERARTEREEREKELAALNAA